jgi:OmpA-OmpF porin, OOP family
MRNLVYFFISLCLCSTAKAQFSVALTGGPQLNSVTPAFTMHPDTLRRSNTKQVGINLGIVANAALDKKQTLFFRTGVLYSVKNSQTDQYFDTVNVDISKGPYMVQATTKLKLNYIDVPINLLYKLPLGGKTKFLFGGGIQGSLFFSGSTNFNTIKATKEYPNSAPVFEYKQVMNEDLPVGNTSNKYQLVHLSMNALTGFEFGRVFITADYSKGLNHFFKTEQNSFKHQTLGAHLGIYFGSSKSPKPKVQKDSDNDGINDDLDACPDQPGTELTKGCPDKDGDGIADKEDKCPDQPGTLRDKGCPVPDKDKDGIRDDEDKCPNLAGSKKYEGCPVPDSDNDGVNDEEDKCPDVSGAKDNHGCPKVTKEQQQKVSYAAKRIEFEFKKIELSKSSFKQLDEVVEILKSNPTLNIRIEGHTSGPVKEANTILSQQRAESVKEYFINKGIPANRILAVGLGSSRHISKDGDKKENPIDRRVELIIF